jgi:hypothetical protein
VWWLSRHPALALLGATGLLSPVVFPPATLHGQGNDGAQTSSAKTSILNLQPFVMTITNDFELSRGPTSFDRAVKNIQDQIDKRREVELDKATPLGAIWRARFWDYLPRSTGGSMNSPVAGVEDDPFIIPSYLLLQNMILERQAAKSDAVARDLFGR